MKPSVVLPMIAAIFVAGCATVRQSDLDAWVGVPVEALDTHSLFITVPMFKTNSASGIEIRNYANGVDISECFGGGSGSANRNGRSVSATTFTTCTSSKIVCNNIFYIREGKVIEYAPTGRCMTDERVRPQARYQRLAKP